jgi:hypothetical protein
MFLVRCEFLYVDTYVYGEYFFDVTKQVANDAWDGIYIRDPNGCIFMGNQGEADGNNKELIIARNYSSYTPIAKDLEELISGSKEWEEFLCYKKNGVRYWCDKPNENASEDIAEVPMGLVQEDSFHYANNI